MSFSVTRTWRRANAETLACVSLVVLLGLRVFAALYTTSPVTWDDTVFRTAATFDAERVDLGHAIAHVLLPDSRTMSAVNAPGRTIGYHDWLVLGRVLLPGTSGERVWQLVNVFLFLLQGGAVLTMAAIVRLPRALRYTMTFVFLSAPMTFGLSRWVMTENHVLTAYLMCLASSVACVIELPRHRWSTPRQTLVAHAVAAAALGYLVGIFSSVREYAAPFILLVIAGTVAALIWERRPTTAVAYSLGFVPFVPSLAHTLPGLLATAAHKAGVERYYHSASEWFPHEVLYFWGPALTALAIVGVVFAVRGVVALPSSFKRRTGAGGLVLSLAAAGAVLAAMIPVLVVRNRVARNGIVIVPILLCLCLGWQRDRLAILARTKALGRASVALVLVSWIFLIQQTVFSYDHGRSWRHHCTNLEHYNYPLGLPALPQGEQHTTCDW